MYEEPNLKGAGFMLLTCAVGALTAIIWIGWMLYSDPVVVEVEAEPVIIERVSEEGLAKAEMIKELTGLEIPPEVAKWATITFSGTSVSIDTDSLNVWLGKNWKSK